MLALELSTRALTTSLKVSGGNCGGETPVPIPNTEVKTASADGTWGGTPWESRSSPGFLETPPPRERSQRRGRFSRAGTLTSDRRQSSPETMGSRMAEQRRGGGQGRPPAKRSGTSSKRTGSTGGRKPAASPRAGTRKATPRKGAPRKGGCPAKGGDARKAPTAVRSPAVVRRVRRAEPFGVRWSFVGLVEPYLGIREPIVGRGRTERGRQRRRRASPVPAVRTDVRRRATRARGSARSRSTVATRRPASSGPCASRRQGPTSRRPDERPGGRPALRTVGKRTERDTSTTQVAGAPSRRRRRSGAASGARRTCSRSWHASPAATPTGRSAP